MNKKQKETLNLVKCIADLKTEIRETCPNAHNELIITEMAICLARQLQAGVIKRLAPGVFQKVGE